MNFGKVLRKARLEKGWTLEKLSNMCGYSKALISRIENNSIDPSISSLTKISTALGLKLYDVFADAEPQDCLVVHSGKAPLVKREGDTTLEIVAAGYPGKSMEPFLVTVQPGDSWTEEDDSPPESFIYVISGSIEAQSFGKLNEGDSVYVPRGMAVNWRCVSDTEAKLIIVRYPSKM